MADRQDSSGERGGGEYDFAPQESEAPREKPVEKKAERGPALQERLCPHCGFRIVGKAPKGRCPDCSGMVDETTTGQLQFANGRWLANLSHGALLLAVAVVAHAAAVVMGWRDAGLGAKVLTCAAWGGAMGVWLLTWSEPKRGTKRPVRFAARLATLFVALLWTAVLIKERGGPVEGRNVLVIAALLATIGEAVFVSLYLRTLAVRIPNESLGRQFVNLAFFVAGISLILAAAQWIGQTNVLSMEKTWLFCGFSIVGMVGLVMLWTVVTLLRLAGELRNCLVTGQNIEARKQHQQEKEREAKEQRRR
ncbi:MAG: hypothetical protein FWD53_09495 [Phycisphaerales bacterium]|nr:hypothetical protein [Phycisphaerales bacterium]